MASTDTYNTLISRFKKPNRQSMDRQQMQGQVYNTPGVTAPAKPTLTEAGVEAEKNGTNGEVVQLGDAKPATPEKPATAATPQTPAEPRPALTPEDTKPTMPGLKQEKIKGLKGVDTSPKSLKEWFSWYDEQRRRMGLETEADREKREKKEKAERIVAALGDGISALAQIHYAGKGAVVNPGTGTTLSEGVAKRLERLRQQRDAQENKVLGLLRQRKQDELAEKRAKRDEERLKQAEEKASEQARQNEALRQKWVSEAENTAYKLETDRKYKEGILDLKEEEQEINRKYKEGLITARDAQIQLGYARLRASQQPTTSVTYDNEGNVKSTTVRTKGTGGGTGHGKSSGGSTRQGNSNNQQGGKKSPTGGSGNKPKKKSPTAK